MENNQSCFTNEANHFLNILNNCDKKLENKDKNIVIIDEFFKATSHEENLALSLAFLDELKDLNCYCLCSSNKKEIFFMM